MANEVIINVKANTAKAESGLDRLRGGMKKVGMAATIAGGAIVGFGVASLKSFASAGDEVQKMAIKTGFSTEALSGLRLAAELSGTSLAGLEKGIGRMQRTILDAKDGLSTAEDALARMGIQLDDLEGKNQEEVFKIMLKGLAGISHDGDRAATAMQVFGRAGTALLPMLEGGVEGLEELTGKAAEMGMEFSQNSANSAARLNDSMTTLKASMSGVMMVMGESLAPIISDLAERLGDTIAKVSAWADENPRLAKMIAIATMAVGGLLLVLGPVILAIGALGSIFAVILSPIGLVVGAVAALALAWSTNFLGIRDITSKVFNFIAEKIADKVNAVVKFLNFMIDGVNKVMEFFGRDAIPPIEEMGAKLLEMGKSAKDAAMEFVGLGDASSKATDDIIASRGRLNMDAAIPTTSAAATQAMAAASTGLDTSGEDRSRLHTVRRPSAAAGPYDDTAFRRGLEGIQRMIAGESFDANMFSDETILNQINTKMGVQTNVAISMGNGASE